MQKIIKRLFIKTQIQIYTHHIVNIVILEIQISPYSYSQLVSKEKSGYVEMFAFDYLPFTSYFFLMACTLLQKMQNHAIKAHHYHNKYSKVNVIQITIQKYGLQKSLCSIDILYCNPALFDKYCNLQCLEVFPPLIVLYI